MKFISHRGNLTHSDSTKENTTEQIDKVIYEEGLDCEIDIRGYWGTGLYLGHEKIQEQISVEWLLDRAAQLWIHCKDLESLEILSNHEFSYLLNYFFHDKDDAVLTSYKQIWVHPDSEYLPKNSVAMLKGLQKWSTDEILGKCYGVCSDNIISIKERREKNNLL